MVSTSVMGVRRAQETTSGKRAQMMKSQLIQTGDLQSQCWSCRDSRLQ